MLWKEFMPVLRPLVPGSGDPSLTGCLVSVVALLADVLGWAFNTSFLPILHERMYQIAHRVECVVRVDMKMRIP